MKSAAWRIKHFTDADEAIEIARNVLNEARVLADRVNTASRIDLARAFIDLARVHYRAVEVDVLTKDS